MCQIHFQGPCPSLALNVLLSRGTLSIGGLCSLLLKLCSYGATLRLLNSLFDKATNAYPNTSRHSASEPTVMVVEEGTFSFASVSRT